MHYLQPSAHVVKMRCDTLSAILLLCAQGAMTYTACYLDPVWSRCDDLHCLLPSSSGVVIAPSTSVLAPLIWGEPDMVGLLLCLFGRISGSLVRYISLSELCFPGESTRGCFQGGSERHVDVSSSKDTTRQVVTGYRYRGSTRHVVAD